MRTSRRRLLAVSGGLLAGTAGCLADSGGPSADETVRWEYGTGGRPYAVRRGHLYAIEGFQDGSGGLVAVDTDSGQTEWAFGESGGYTSFTPPAVADALYVGFGDDAVGSGSGALYAIEHGGNQRWALDTGSVYDTPVYSDGVVYAAGDEGTVLAVDAESGERRWAIEPDRETPRPPEVGAVDDETVYVALEGELLAVGAADGTELWRYQGGQRTGRPVVGESAVYVSTGDRVVALENGDERWSVEHDGRLRGLFEGSLYAVGDDEVCALAASDGEGRWCEPAGSLEHAGESGVIVGAEGEKRLRRLSRAGELRWEVGLRDGELDAVSVDGSAVYAETDGAIHRFDDAGDRRGSASLDDIRGHVVGDSVYVGTAERIYRVEI